MSDRNQEDADFARLQEAAPMTVFQEWFAQAAGAVAQPEAAVLATSAAGQPQARVVLVKEFAAGEFVFFSNLGSRKARAIIGNPRAALLFVWPGRQANVEGTVTAISRARTAAYFATRPRESKIGAWASEQSRPVKSPAAFTESVGRMTQKFADQDPPLPPHWGGYALSPLRIEFWSEGTNRLHRRLVFSRKSVQEEWRSEFLQP